MKEHRRLLPALMAAFGMLALILDAKTGLQGAADGIQMCIHTVIPALFPFFVLSPFLTALPGGATFLRPLGKLLRLPPGCESYLLPGVLGGYPVGARCIAQGYRDGAIEKTDAERMLGFCSNAGPAFLFGMGAGVLPEIWMCWLVWGIHILSALFVGLTAPGGSTAAASTVSPGKITLPEAMQQALGAMAAVCGWVVILRVVLAFLQRWALWLFPLPMQIFLSGLLELTNGTCLLPQISCVGLRFLLFTVFLSFGGLCVLLQTRSVIRESGLSGRDYFPGKVTQAAVSTLLCAAVMPLVDDNWMPSLWVVLPAGVIVVTGLILSAKEQNSSSFSRLGSV